MGEEAPPKFFCDEQLGKLARWLRIIGVDTEFKSGIDDLDLLARARADGRTVLTKDTRLAEKDPVATVVWLESNYPAHQLREVVRMYRDRIEIAVFSRCPSCNGAVEAVDKPQVEGRVPEFVWETQQRFTRCTECGKIYWQATHRERVEIQLRDVLGELYRPQGQ